MPQQLPQVLPRHKQQRVLDWPKRLFAAVKKHDRGLVLGKSDCSQLALDCIDAVTGERPSIEIPAYVDEEGAQEVLHHLGVRTLIELPRQLFPEIHPVLAQRGDIGISRYKGRNCLVVCEGPRFVGKVEDGLLRIPREQVYTAFAVGRPVAEDDTYLREGEVT